jgi:hypothetical protein
MIPTSAGRTCQLPTPSACAADTEAVPLMFSSCDKAYCPRDGYRYSFNLSTFTYMRRIVPIRTGKRLIIFKILH